MLLLHVDDFMMVGDEDFVEETTKMFREHLTVSKVEDGRFRYCGVDLEMEDNKIVLSMEGYVQSLEEVPLRAGKKEDSLTKEETSLMRKITGKLAWLANSTCPYLNNTDLAMSTYSPSCILQKSLSNLCELKLFGSKSVQTQYLKNNFLRSTTSQSLF